MKDCTLVPRFLDFYFKKENYKDTIFKIEKKSLKSDGFYILKGGYFQYFDIYFDIYHIFLTIRLQILNYDFILFCFISL